MHKKLTVVVSEASHIPYAQIPCDCMWDITEYLSFQRVAVVYDFKGTHFTVSFPKLRVARAQEILDQWATSSVDACHAG
jgi:hypothetical protein